MYIDSPGFFFCAQYKNKAFFHIPAPRGGDKGTKKHLALKDGYKGMDTILVYQLSKAAYRASER